MVVLIMALIIVVCVILILKWKVSTLALICYMEKSQYKLPEEKEMKECIGFVIENMIKDLTGRNNKR